jgi:hypothetical protein
MPLRTTPRKANSAMDERLRKIIMPGDRWTVMVGDERRRARVLHAGATPKTWHCVDLDNDQLFSVGADQFIAFDAAWRGNQW